MCVCASTAPRMKKDSKVFDHISRGKERKKERWCCQLSVPCMTKGLRQQQQQQQSVGLCVGKGGKRSIQQHHQFAPTIRGRGAFGRTHVRHRLTCCLSLTFLSLCQAARGRHASGRLLPTPPRAGTSLRVSQYAKKKTPS